MVTKKVGGYDVRDARRSLVRVHRNTFYVSVRWCHQAAYGAYLYYEKVAVVVVLKRVSQAAPLLVNSVM